MSRRKTSRGELIETEEALADVVETLSSVDRFGIDTEFHRERTYYPRLALVQIAWEDGLVLLDPLAVDVSSLAKAFSSGPLVILHAADQDLEVLQRACGRLPEQIFDTQLCAGFIGYCSPSLSNLVESLLGVRLQKGDQLTDWMRRPLSESQLAYAAGDVAYLLELHSMIEERLEAARRSEWAAQECAVLLNKDHSETRPEHAWWKLPHARQLRGPARGIAQEIAAWREKRAQRLDLPVRFVLSDMAVGSLAQRPPSNKEELLRTRGVDSRHLGGNAAGELLEAVRRGRQLSPQELQLPASQAPERPNKPMIALASAYVGQRAGELSIDPAILATRADLVSFFQPEPAGRLVSGWRNNLLGRLLGQLAEGKAALAFDGSGGLVLEERSNRPLA
jgi:ribonuclease D